MRRMMTIRTFVAAGLLLAIGAPALAQGAGPAPAPAPVTAMPAAPVATTPADYLIGPDDVLSIVFWRDKDMTTDVVVRPDGKISLPVLNELQASGLTPEQLRASVLEAATKYFESPSVNVVVKQINSRKVFVTGEVNKPGTYSLTSAMTVLQLISVAGGFNDFAKKGDVAVIRTEEGQQKRYRVNYDDIIKGRNLKQNIELKVGDVIVVP